MADRGDMLANRLHRNLARLGPWARREGLDAWRVYDRDIPELPWSVDLYGDRALLTEHLTPVARRREMSAASDELAGVIAAAGDVLHVPRERIATRTRMRHRSIERESAGDPRHEFPVSERGLRFLVNLDDYLDTGLFLDHREARRRLRDEAKGARVLNLFCCTGSFTVCAAAGGAAGTVSVDLSATYLEWALRNLRLNGLAAPAHVLVREDVFHWLKTSRETFDRIILDPPTVSRAARGRSFDLDAAHVELIGLAAARLAKDGVLLFSTNKRGFALDATALEAFDVREVTDAIHSRDFRERVPLAWEVRKR